MSGSSVLLYVGATTLAAAIVTLCAFQITATSMDRKRSRRPRTLEGPVPGRQSLSSIGLNTQTGRSAPSSSGHQGQRPTTPAGIPKDNSQKPGLPTSDTSQLPPPAKETKLNSLQTIRARSAALQSDGPPGKPANPKSLLPAYAPSTQRPVTRAVPVQEPGSAAPQATSSSEQQENIDRIPSNAGLAGDSTAPATIQKSPSSKRAKRANTQTELIETAHPNTDPAPADALANPADLELLGTLQSSPVGGSPNQEDDMLDIFAGLSEAEVGLQDLTDDLNDIDSGGLPTAAPKTAQKSRR
jgi:hypothetical protein